MQNASMQACVADVLVPRDVPRIQSRRFPGSEIPRIFRIHEPPLSESIIFMYNPALCSFSGSLT